jgi:ribosomal protein S18 acetylase RimI-like enzyme
VALVAVVAYADHLLIENLAVAPSHQRQGHGRRAATGAVLRRHGRNSCDSALVDLYGDGRAIMR